MEERERQMKSILFAKKSKTNRNTNEDANGSSRKSKSNKRKEKKKILIIDIDTIDSFRFISAYIVFGQNNDQQVFVFFIDEIDRSTIEFINDRSTVIDDY